MIARTKLLVGSVIILSAFVGASMADPFECGEAEVVSLGGIILADGDYLSCTAKSRFDLGPDLTLEPGAELDIRAPSIQFLPSVNVASDAALSAGSDICGESVTFESGKSPDEEIHVATTGTFNPGCGAPASPCGSIEYAANLAEPGTAIIVHAGTYAGDQFISDLSGEPERPIWIGGAPGEPAPTIEGGTQGIHFSKVRYLIVHNLVVRNSSNRGINVDDGELYDDVDATRYLVLRDLFFQDIGTEGNHDCLKLSGVDDFWVYDSVFGTCDRGEAIDAVGCHTGEIFGNLFQYTEDSGNAVQFKGGSEDIEVRANLFDIVGGRAINMGGSTGLPFFRPPVSELAPFAEARNIRFVSNIVRGSFSPIAFAGCVDCLAANNTIDTPEGTVVSVLNENLSALAPSNGRFINNIVYFDDQVNFAFLVGSNTAPETFVIQSNLWYRYDLPIQSFPPGGLPVTESDQLAGFDPGFANPGIGDFHISNDSPAYRSGTELGEVRADFDGACYASPPSRGAFETD